MKRVLFALVTGLLALGVLSQVVQAQDKIFKKDGTTLPRPGGREVTVIKETFTTVEYKLRGLGSSLGIPAKDVARIEYDRKPDAYSAGLQSFQDQIYDQAIEDFMEAIKRGRGYHWVEQNALYNIATCYVKRGMYNEATSTFRKLLSTVPTTRFLPDAWLGMGTQPLQQRQYRQQHLPQPGSRGREADPEGHPGLRARHQEEPTSQGLPSRGGILEAPPQGRQA